MLLKKSRADISRSPLGKRAVIIASICDAAGGQDEGLKSKRGASVGSGDRCSVHAAANKPPARSALLRNARRMASTSGLGHRAAGGALYLRLPQAAGLQRTT